MSRDNLGEPIRRGDRVIMRTWDETVRVISVDDESFTWSNNGRLDRCDAGSVLIVEQDGKHSRIPRIGQFENANTGDVIVVPCQFTVGVKL